MGKCKVPIACMSLYHCHSKRTNHTGGEVEHQKSEEEMKHWRPNLGKDDASVRSLGKLSLNTIDPDLDANKDRNWNGSAIIFKYHSHSNSSCFASLSAISNKLRCLLTSHNTPPV